MFLSPLSSLPSSLSEKKCPQVRIIKKIFLQDYHSSQNGVVSGEMREFTENN